MKFYQYITNRLNIAKGPSYDHPDGRGAASAASDEGQQGATGDGIGRGGTSTTVGFKVQLSRGGTSLATSYRRGASSAARDPAGREGSSNPTEKALPRRGAKHGAVLWRQAFDNDHPHYYTRHAFHKSRQRRGLTYWSRNWHFAMAIHRAWQTNQSIHHDAFGLDFIAQQENYKIRHINEGFNLPLAGWFQEKLIDKEGAPQALSEYTCLADIAAATGETEDKIIQEMYGAIEQRYFKTLLGYNPNKGDNQKRKWLPARKDFFDEKTPENFKKDTINAFLAYNSFWHDVKIERSGSGNDEVIKYSKPINGADKEHTELCSFSKETIGKDGTIQLKFTVNEKLTSTEEIDAALEVVAEQMSARMPDYLRSCFGAYKATFGNIEEAELAQTLRLAQILICNKGMLLNPGTMTAIYAKIDKVIEESRIPENSADENSKLVTHLKKIKELLETANQNDGGKNQKSAPSTAREKLARLDVRGPKTNGHVEVLLAMGKPKSSANQHNLENSLETASAQTPIPSSSTKPLGGQKNQ